MVLFVGIAVHGLTLVGCYLLFIKFVCVGSIVVEGNVLSLVLVCFFLIVIGLNYKEVKFFFRNSLIKKENFIPFLSVSSGTRDIYYDVYQGLKYSQLNSEHYFLILPELCLGISILILLLVSVYFRVKNKPLTLNTILVYKYSVVSLVLTFFFLIVTFLYWYNCKEGMVFFLFNEMLIVDFYSFLVRGLLLTLTIILLISSWRFITTQCLKTNVDLVEVPILIIASLLFMFVMVSSINLTTAYISLEGLTLLIYLLIVIPFKRENFEAVVKYFYLSAICSVIFLYGLSLLYALTGMFSYFDISFYLFNNIFVDSLYNNSILKFIVAAIVVMFLFKTGCFPFH